ncbi:MAG: hypothetical protein SH817_06530 [Leptospira sp.]|nr:hypothetical protein [Leptospira sp.]
MGRQDNIKIFTTALLVVLLLSSFIFGFVYRNEIYQKIQVMTKSSPMSPAERIIEKEPAWTAPTELKTDELTKKDPLSSETEKKNERADIPALDEMEADINTPGSKSVSVTNVQSNKKEKKETVDPIAETKEIIKTDFTKTESKKSNLSTKSITKKQTTIKQKVKKETNRLSNRTNLKVKKSSPIKTAKLKTNDANKQTSTSKSDSSLEARMQAIESKFVLQNQKNDTRFAEIEKRIDKLEKSLGSN